MTKAPKNPGLPPGLPADIAAMPFEAALAELEKLVKQMEQGAISLEDAVSAHERGCWLKLYCEHKLTGAQLRIEQIQLQADGTPAAVPFNI